VARIKDDLRAWRLGHCVFVGDGGMYSAVNMAALSRGLGRYVLAVPLRRVKEIGGSAEGGLHRVRRAPARDGGAGVRLPLD
jgi:hypothetical protein